MIAAIRRTSEPEIEMSESKVLVSFDEANPRASMIDLRILRLRLRAASVGPSVGGRVGLLSVPSRAPWMG
jgi:hypothetical protein